MTNSDFRIQVGLFSHPKFIKLKRKLGAEGALAYVQFLSHVAVNKPDGVLTNMDADDIAIAGDYSGDGQAFLDALIAVRFVDVDPDTKQRSIHDWAEHNPWAAGAIARSEKASAAANARWEKERQEREERERQAEQRNAKSMQSALPQTQDSTAQPMPSVCSEYDLALPQAPFSNAPYQPILTSQPLPFQPIHPNPPVRPSPDSDTATGMAQTAEPPGPMAGRRTDGDMPNGLWVSEQIADPSLSPEARLHRFKNSAFWSDWGQHIGDVLNRATKRKCSEAKYLEPVLLRILRGEELRPGEVQASASERHTEREKAAQNRVVKAQVVKLDIPKDWMPDVDEETVREFCRRALQNVKVFQADVKPLDESVRNEARRLWRLENPHAPLMEWEEAERKKRADVPVSPDLAAKMASVGTPRKSVETGQTLVVDDANYSAPNNLPEASAEVAP